MGNENLSPFGNALAGAIGGIISNGVVYPLDTIKTKIQADSTQSSSNQDMIPSPKLKRQNAPNRLTLPKLSFREVMIEIFKHQGLSGFYRGFLASMLNTFSMQFAYFYWYTIVRKTYLRSLFPIQKGKDRSQKEHLSIGTELGLGAISGAIAQIFTIPVSVIATRQQLETSKTESKSLMKTATEIIQEDGLTGLWRGLRPSLVLTVNPAITYGMFERLKVFFLGMDGKLTPGKAFLMGALSKTMATVVTYPYIMAKVRLQAKYDDDDEHHEEVHQTVEKGESPSDRKFKDHKKKERYEGALDVLRKVASEKGLSGWYQGMQAQITKAVLSQALLFGIKDLLEDYTVLILILFSKWGKKRILN
ncbi:mitochondrial carrier domain-containing protein [Melampsora americana]|nr:mitochondrial carrier domain-containing protein [Melampsora americana]